MNRTKGDLYFFDKIINPRSFGKQSKTMFGRLIDFTTRHQWVNDAFRRSDPTPWPKAGKHDQ